MKSLKGEPFFTFSLPGGAYLCPPSVTPLVVTHVSLLLTFSQFVSVKVTWVWSLFCIDVWATWRYPSQTIYIFVFYLFMWLSQLHVLHHKALLKEQKCITVTHHKVGVSWYAQVVIKTEQTLGNVPWDGMGQHTFVFPMRLRNRMRVSECYWTVILRLYFWILKSINFVICASLCTCSPI